MYNLLTGLLIVEHSHIDVLKIDLEGWEFEVLPQILQPYIASGEPLPFGQLLIEIHTWDKRFEDFLTWWELLEAAGLRPFMTEARITCNMSHLLWSLISTQVNLVYQNYNRGKPTDLAEVCLLVLFPLSFYSVLVSSRSSISRETTSSFQIRRLQPSTQLTLINAIAYFSAPYVASYAFILQCYPTWWR